MPAMSLRQDSSANSPIAKQQASPHRTIPHGVDAKTLAPCDFGTGPDCLPEAPLGTSIIGVDDVLGRVVSAGLDAVGCSSNTCQFAAAVVLHKIPALKKPVGRSTADVATASDVAKNELRRPYIRNSTRDVVESRAPRDATGRPLDPNTGKPIEGRPDLGHKTGSEFRREKARANAEGVPAANKSVQSLVSKEESIYVVGLHGSCATC